MNVTDSTSHPGQCDKVAAHLQKFVPMVDRIAWSAAMLPTANLLFDNP